MRFIAETTKRLANITKEHQQNANMCKLILILIDLCLTIPLYFSKS